MCEPDQPFGGKVLVLGGDYRQCLPVVPGANRAQIVDICLPNSFLWQNFDILSLTVNMRVRACGNTALQNFDEWTLSIGDGNANDLQDMVKIPEEMNFDIRPNTEHDSRLEEKSMVEFCNKIFPNLHANIQDPEWLCGRSILTPTNKEVDTINDMMEAQVPGSSLQLTSADQLEEYQDFMRYTTEYLNTLCPNGFPRHRLCLKPGMPLMILRNISPKEGLCNGTKVTYIRCLNNKLLVCKLSGSGKEVLIPRIKFISDPLMYTFNWSRRQFPVRMAFATTINKSQGQTLLRVGVWLRSHPFSHGQLYVASSRTGDPDALTFAVRPQENIPHGKTLNPVFKEVLINHSMQEASQETAEEDSDS